MNVGLAGSSNFSEETNAAGCAIFSFVPAGNYTATISDAGPPALVDWDGQTNHVEAVTSTAGQTTTYGPYEMERPAQIDAQFQTKVGSFAADREQVPLHLVQQREAGRAVADDRRRHDRGQLDDRLRDRALPVPRRLRRLRRAGAARTRPSVQNVSVTPNSATTTNPKIWTPSINIRVRQRGRRAPR